MRLCKKKPDTAGDGGAKEPASRLARCTCTPSSTEMEQWRQKYSYWSGDRRADTTTAMVPLVPNAETCCTCVHAEC